MSTFVLTAVSVSLATIAALTAGKPVTYTSEELLASGAKRSDFLKSVHSFALAGNSVMAKCDKALRVAIERPNDPAAIANAENAIDARNAWIATRDRIALMFMAVKTLHGQEYGKTRTGDSVKGEHLATVMFGAFGKGDARAMLKELA